MALQRDILFIGTVRGLFRCDYATRGWTVTPLYAGVSIIRIMAFDSATISIIDSADTTWQTFDGGVNWREGGNLPALPPPPLVHTRHGPATLSNPRLSFATAYARLHDRDQTLVGAGANGMLLFRSEDDGIHWEPAAVPPDAGRIVALVPSISVPRGAWAATDRGALLATIDAGTTWTQVAQLEAAAQTLASVEDDDVAEE